MYMCYVIALQHDDSGLSLGLALVQCRHGATQQAAQ